MTDAQILKTIIMKTLPNAQFAYCEVKEPFHVTMVDHDGVPFMFNTEAIIFNHEFAQKLWGKEDFRWLDLRLVNPNKQNVKGLLSFNVAELHAPAWRYHLQQLVLAEDPIKYLEDYL